MEKEMYVLRDRGLMSVLTKKRAFMIKKTAEKYGMECEIYYRHDMWWVRDKAKRELYERKNNV